MFIFYHTALAVSIEHNKKACVFSLSIRLNIRDKAYASQFICLV